MKTILISPTNLMQRMCENRRYIEENGYHEKMSLVMTMIVVIMTMIVVMMARIVIPTKNSKIPSISEASLCEREC